MYYLSIFHPNLSFAFSLQIKDSRLLPDLISFFTLKKYSVVVRYFSEVFYGTF